MEEFSFLCSCCGERHDGLPDLAFGSPLFWNEAGHASDPDERFLDDDLCILGEHRFIRCILTLPIRGTVHRLGWGVWVSQSEHNFELYRTSFSEPEERVTVGYLANRLPAYPDTLNMLVQTHWTRDGKRPWVELEPSDHPLFRDWKDGVERAQAVALAELVLHPQRRN